jgi:molybdopterin synthase catalytic subunit
MIHVEISDAAIDPAMLIPLNALGGGAVASFTGIARADGNVTAIELEHYPAMTWASLDMLSREAVARWSLLGCVLIHRVGRIEVGNVIVLVGTAAGHRAEALDACAFLIDRLKTDALFWKKEHRSDGSAGWVEAKASDNARGDRWR